MIFYWLIVVYLISAIFTPWAGGIINECSDEDEEQESEIEKYIIEVGYKINSFVPIINTVFVVIALFILTLTLICEINLCILKLRMKYSKGVNKFKIGRKIFEKE